jgi:hypothetical protein
MGFTAFPSRDQLTTPYLRTEFLFEVWSLPTVKAVQRE